MRWLSRLISIVVFAALVVGVALLIRSRMPVTTVGERFMTCALFRDGTRIATGSPVMIAGVHVGEVERLSIEGKLARVDMRLQDRLQIPNDSWVTKRAYSAFGDNYIEIIPSDPVPGAPTAQMLRTGECLTRVAEGDSTDRLLRSLARTMPKVDDGLERVHEVGMYGRKWVAGTLEDALVSAQRWLDEERIERPLRSADEALATIESATTGAADAVHEAMPDIDRTLGRIQSGVTTARQRLGEVTVDLRDGFQSAREGLDGVDETIADLQEVVAAVDEGRGDDAKGTLGRLINDGTLADDIEDAAASIHAGLTAFTRFKSWLGLRTEFNLFAGQPRFFVTAEIRARTDKFYLVELERGPIGDYPDGSLADNPGSPEYNRQQVIRDRLRFTAQFGKTFGNWFQVRGGVKESTFGFGADMLLSKGRLKISGDFYGGYTRTPRLKLTGALEVFRSAYIIAGVDDALTSPGYLSIAADGSGVPNQFERVRFGRDYFLGATLHFTDADLAVLLRVYGALLVGLL